MHQNVLITGGAGFIGTNLADRLLFAGHQVILYDNLSRRGVENNLAWLKSRHGRRVRHELGDVRDYENLRRVVGEAAHVFHLAAPVAITTSLEPPFEDLELNARGTLNLLQALRSLPNPPPLLFTSTNEPGRDLSADKLGITRGRYQPEAQDIRSRGFGELCPLSFHSSYGGSKGAAQYVQDYARTFGLQTVLFRMSCIYGPHQFGTEADAWLAHSLIRTLEEAPLTIYGDGRQVRDLLFVHDLVEAFLLAQQHIGKLAGQAFNIGGGPANTISLLELLDLLARLHGHAPKVRFVDWQPADHQCYVSDTRKFSQLTGWIPQVGVKAGIQQLYQWLKDYRRDRASVLAIGMPLPRADGDVKRVSLRAIRPRTVPRKIVVKLKAPANGYRLNGHRLGQKLARAI